VKDNASAGLVSGGSSPILKSSPSHHTPPQRDRPKEAGKQALKGKEKEDTRMKRSDAGDADEYSESFEEDSETRNSASQEEKSRGSAGFITCGLMNV
jgi:hypothetical protein